MFDIMPSLELAFGERAFQKAPFLISKLSKFVVTPNEEGPVVKGGSAMSASASQVCDLERDTLVQIYKA
jgi:hypothetical protein